MSVRSATVAPGKSSFLSSPCSKSEANFPSQDCLGSFLFWRNLVSPSPELVSKDWFKPLGLSFHNYCRVLPSLVGPSWHDNVCFFSSRHLEVTFGGTARVSSSALPCGNEKAIPPVVFSCRDILLHFSGGRRLSEVFLFQ